MSSMRIIRKLPDAPPYHKTEISSRVYSYKSKHMRVLDHDPKPSPAATFERHPRTNITWTDEKLRELGELYDSGATLTVIGEHFSYTEGAISKYIKKARDLGYVTTTRRAHRPWTAEEDNTLKWMRKQGKAFDVIAHQLGRSRESCMARMKLLRKGVMK